MKRILQHGKLTGEAVYFRPCPICGCVFEYTAADIDNTQTLYDRGQPCIMWRVSCPECEDKGEFAEPTPIRYG